MEAIAAQLHIMKDYAMKNKVPIIQQEAEDILTDLVRKNNPQTILEIGTAIGYSTLVMAAQLPAASRILTIELSEERAELARKFIRQAGVEEQITLLCGDAGKIIPQLMERFDMVFIDAAKGQYPDYLAKLMDKLTAGACIVADNVLFRGMVMNENDAAPRRFRTIVKRLRSYLHTVSADPRFSTTLYQTEDGLAVSYLLEESKS